MVIDMDPAEKKRIDNEKRLKAIKEWKKNRNFQNIKPVNTHVIFDDDVNDTCNKSNKPKLFEISDDERKKFEECFESRPQFDGPHGQELLEMSSQLSGRFKLDERFREEELQPQESPNEEKEKNLKILQNVLGFDVSSKTLDKHQTRKRQIRFDPENESSSKYVKFTEAPIEKPKKKKRENLEEKSEPNIPISTERYSEVSSNLKDILSAPSTGFSLTQKFRYEAYEERTFPEENNANEFFENEEVFCDPVSKDKKEIEERKRYRESIEERKNPHQELDSRHFVSRMKNDSFFFKEGDPRLKEGIEFFKRTKPMEEIREDWSNTKEYVKNQFRQKKRSNLRSHAPRGKTSQMKHAIRRQN